MLTLDHQMARLWAEHREDINKEAAAIVGRVANRAAQTVRALATAAMQPRLRVIAGLGSVLASATFIVAALLPAWVVSGAGGTLVI